ncbi:hypothetical protein WN55_04064 [Dufourea novaeangliae]|uniref:Uncharacterized protein n=1 Tax=Dufourea novaeangliae TaxID=178035 RepID=A0A154PMB0_DUFNO|nr:hypothetical protein WN55_04064 [Dufourea novaeangliae]
MDCLNLIPVMYVLACYTKNDSHRNFTVSVGTYDGETVFLKQQFVYMILR